MSWAPVRSTAVMMAGCLLAFGAAMILSRVGDQGLGPMVLAVVLSMSLARQRRHAGSGARLLIVVAATVLAGAVGWLLASPLPVVGDIAFVLVVAGGIALRRFGPTGTSLGVVATMPMIGLLVVPIAPHGPAGIPVLVATAVATIACVALTTAVAERTGFLTAPVPAPTWIPPARPERRLLPSDRMALQMAIGLAAAFVVGRSVFGPHWPWVVLTAYVVAGGARSRGDVLHRGLQRTAGAAAGTALAALAGLGLAPGSAAPIVAIFVVLALASWLRQLSYAWWAAGVTTIVALLSDFLGQDAAAVLPYRLAAIAVGGVLAVAAAWFVLPIRTSSVVRRRVADALAALQDVLAAPPDALDETRARFAATLERLGEIAPSVRAHRRLLTVLRRGTGRHPADTIDAVLACAGPVDDLHAAAARAGAAKLVGALRRGLREPSGHLSPAFGQLPERLRGAAAPA